jgi:hypothetical protein
MSEQDSGEDGIRLDAGGVAEMLFAVWRAKKRSDREETPEAVRVALETVSEQIEALSFRYDEMVGQPYDENMRVRVAHHEGGPVNMRIIECLGPAIYHDDRLIRPADVVVRGDEDGSSNS